VVVLYILVAALLFFCLYLLYRFRRPLPKIKGRLEIAGLKQTVEVIRDRWGVPHIYAADLHDLFFAQGYVQAQDRLWQMELNRRLATGRLSEIFGQQAFEADRFVLTVGLKRAAENDLACMSPENRTLLDAYLRGVNAFIAANRSKLPLEFALLGLKPEPWQPIESLAWVRMQAWQLSENWDTELLHAALIAKLGPERAAGLHGCYPRINPVILAEQTVIEAAERVLESFRHAEKWFPACALQGMSNSWAVSGERSRTGNALYAYDPHLGLHVPSLWHEVHLVCPQLQASGATFPGVPGVIVGHNEHITFGFTNSFADVQDLYLERFNPDNSIEYRDRGKWRKAEIIVEEIKVRGEREPRRIEVVVTRHGPVIGGLHSLGSQFEEGRFALRWAGFDGFDVLEALLRMDRARNWSEFCAAMSVWDTPPASALYADKEGNIGYTLTGKIPVRGAGSGLVPAPGWSDEYEWQGWIPWEQMPREYNPQRGYLVTANNQVGGREYPHYIGLGTCNGNRAARIAALIEGRDKLSLEDFARMQVDLYSEPARRFAALLDSLGAAILGQEVLAPLRNRAEQALALFAGWDGEMTASSSAAALYAVAEYFCKRRLFEPWLGELTDHYCGVGLHVFSSVSLYREYSHLLALEILENEDRRWLDTPEGGKRSREQVLAAALKDAIVFLVGRLGKNQNKWKYGSIHKARFHHPLGSRKPLHLIFNPKPVPYGGSGDTVWQGKPLVKIPPDRGGSYSASWRQLIDLSDWEKAQAIHPPGQSGHPASRHYKDFTALWSSGGYHPMLWGRERVESEAEARLLLAPAGKEAGREAAKTKPGSKRDI